MLRMLPRRVSVAARTAGGSTTSSCSRTGSNIALLRGVTTWRCSRVAARSVPGDAAQDQCPKAALVVIGNEVLSGSVVDANAPWLAKLLHSRGVDLIRVEYVPDDLEDISMSVQRLRTRVGSGGFVFTSGGTGPTHDDVTYEAIAHACGSTLQLHQPTVSLMEPHFAAKGVELSSSLLRMALLPHPAEVLYAAGCWVPLVHVDGIYVLPGIPALFRTLVEGQQERFTGRAFAERVLYSTRGEGDLAEGLRAIAAAHPDVAIGSYPATHALDQYTVKLSFTCRDEAKLARAVDAALGALDVSERLPVAA